MATAALLVAEAVHVELPMPAWMYGAIALGAFVVLGIVTWSFRNVAERHAHKLKDSDPAHQGH
jgi:hypothetical protein